ncbi:hypothetical protein R3Q06_02450 [Rhodococcus erythropolis]|uniref:hypothetical protein n=1 Tax=Rhodococcus erythropolis TaxID=1833 RepID=UPI002949757B|nr:hypothetical protein [Rhodococcus erythropolis]MDV6272351.1 hypothetical protein [Rhodococcus erythropolis]
MSTETGDRDPMSFKNMITGDHRDPKDELVDIFGTDQERDAALDRATEWARGVVSAAEVPASNQIAAIAALRAAEPRLGLKSATHLAALLVN